MVVGQYTVGVGVSSSCEAVSGRGTDRGLGKTVVEAHTSSRKSIQIRCMSQGITKTTEGVETMMVAHKDKNVHDEFLLCVSILWACRDIYVARPYPVQNT